MAGQPLSVPRILRAKAENGITAGEWFCQRSSSDLVVVTEKKATTKGKNSTEGGCGEEKNSETD